MLAIRICGPCSKSGHQPEDCENTTRPMCHRACPCRHGVEPDPAPYWSTPATTTEPAAAGSEQLDDTEPDGQPDPLAQARELPTSWVTPAGEASARAAASAAGEDWHAIGQRRRVAHRIAAYRSRRPNVAKAG